MSTICGLLASPDALNPLESEHRVRVSAMQSMGFGTDGQWSTTWPWEANAHPVQPRLSNRTRATVGLGMLATLSVDPAVLRSTYGSQTPAGFMVFLRLRPLAPGLRGMQGMGGTPAMIGAGRDR